MHIHNYTCTCIVQGYILGGEFQSHASYIRPETCTLRNSVFFDADESRCARLGKYLQYTSYIMYIHVHVHD